MKYAIMVLALVGVFALPTATIADETGKHFLDGNRNGLIFDKIVTLD